MTYTELVAARRSIRKFLPQPVSDEQIRQLLQWGHAAPPAGNLCPWEFILIRSEAGKRAVTDATFCGNQETGTGRQEWILSAPVVIAVCSNEDRIRARYGNTGIWPALSYLDCSACIENILLGAVELGLGSCYVSGFREPELKRALALPEHVRPIALLPVGYPALTGHARPRPDLDTLLHLESYSPA